MAFGSDNKMVLEVTMDASGAITGFAKLAEKTDEAGEAAKKAGGNFSSFMDGIFQGIGQGVVFTAVSSLELLKNSILAIPDAIARGSTIDDISGSFESLASKAGVAGDALINDFSSALGNTVPKVDLMKQANELLLGGLDPSQFELVAKAARSLGDVTGGSATDGLNALSDSLLKGNDKALKNLGIIVDNDKAYRDFAASIGTTADKLNEEGRVLATRQAVLEALKQKQQELGNVTNDAADNIDSMKSTLRNWIDEALRAIGSNKELTTLLGELAESVKRIDFKEIISGISSFVSTVSSLAIPAIQELDTIVKGYIVTQKTFLAIAQSDPRGFLLPGVWDSVRSEIVKADFATKELTSTVSKLEQINKALTFAKTTEDVDRLKNQFVETSVAANKLGVKYSDLKPLGEKFAEVSAKAKEAIVGQKKSLSELSGETTKTSNNTRTLIDETKRAEEATRKLEKQEAERKKQLEELQKAQQELNREILKAVLSSEDYEKIQKDLVEGTIDNVEANKRIKAEFVQVEKATNDLKAAQEDYDRVMADANATLDQRVDALQRVAEAEKNLSDARGKAPDLDNVFKGIQDQFDDFFKAGTLFTKLGEAASGILSEIVQAAFDGKTLKSEDYGQILGSKIGEMFADIPIVGDLAATIADNLVQEVFDYFSSEGAGTKARKAADKFFAEMFEANNLAVVINDQLVRINDLVFKGDTFFGGDVNFGDSSFSQYLQSLPAQAQASFSGVGTAFEEFLGVSGDISGQIGAVIANNIGGSLNNLQLLVQATGKSFEELQAIIVEAFLDGKLSAAEAQAQLEGVKKVAEKGIPDGIGLVSQAFENMRAATAKGGRALVDALQDVGFEAKELGLKTLPELMDYLVNVAGVSKDEVQQVMTALKNSGIDSVEELTNATTEQLIPVLAELENTKFPFAEQIKDAKELINTLESIPSQKSVEIDFRVNASAEDRATLQQIQEVNAGRGQGVPQY